jgi:hypothetical protein
MVRCVDCANFNPKTRECLWSGAFLTEQSSKKSLPCDGFQRRKNNGKEACELHHEMPSGRLVRCR